MDTKRRGRPPRELEELPKVREILPDDERDECLLTRRSERWLAGLIEVDTDVPPDGETGWEFLAFGHRR